MPSTSPVGFLGLGRMGAAIALRLVAADVAVVAWNRSESDALRDLTAMGASTARDAAEALAAPVSFSMLADDTAAETVLSRVNIGRDPDARVHVNCASVSPEMADLLARRFADAGVQYVGAPVLGRPEVAKAGNLNVLLAGPDDAIARVEPLFGAFAARQWRLGAIPRQANVVKIALNFMLLHALQSMSEGIALVEAEGIPAAHFVELFTNTFFGGVVYSTYGEMMAERRYAPPGFTVALGLKDLGLAERLAAQSRVNIPTATVLREQFGAARADPALADLDWSVVAELTRRGASAP